MECLLDNTFSGLLLLVLAFPFFVVNCQIITKGQGAYKEGRGQRYPHSFQLLCKQQFFLFIAGQDGSPGGCPERQRPNNGDHNEKNDQKPQVSEVHFSG